MYFFFVFLLSITLLGSFIVGPFSIRVYATVAMLLFLLYNRTRRKQDYVSIDHSLLKIYIFFVIIMGFTQCLNGEIFEYQYFKRLLAYHLVCVVAFLSIEYFLNTNKELKRTILLLSVVLLINNLTTILQFTGNELGWAIGMFFCDISNNSDFASNHDSLIGFSNTPGIYGNVVANAFVIAVTSPMILCLLDDSSNKFTKIYALASYSIASVACFMTQQRASFYLFLLCLAIYLFVTIRKHAVIIFVLGVLAMMFVDDINFGNMDIGRLSKTTDDGRRGLYKHAFEFISEHPILGGPMSFQRMAGLSSHNVALDSWIFAGFFGFVTMMILICKTLLLGIKTFIKGINVKGQDRYMIFCSVAVINAMVYGFTHNTSYLTGDVFVFIALALMLKSLNINYK